MNCETIVKIKTSWNTNLQVTKTGSFLHPYFSYGKTSVNNHIHQNFPFALQGRVQSSHNHSQREVQGALMEDNHTGFQIGRASCRERV